MGAPGAPGGPTRCVVNRLSRLGRTFAYLVAVTCVPGWLLFGDSAPANAGRSTTPVVILAVIAAAYGVGSALAQARYNRRVRNRYPEGRP